MDPNETLRLLRQAYQRPKGWSAAEILGLVMDLDEWITNGGFLPDSWQQRSSKMTPEVRLGMKCDPATACPECN